MSRTDTSVALSLEDKAFLEQEAKAAGHTLKEELHCILVEWRKR